MFIPINDSPQRGSIKETHGTPQHVTKEFVVQWACSVHCTEGHAHRKSGCTQYWKMEIGIKAMYISWGYTFLNMFLPTVLLLILQWFDLRRVYQRLNVIARSMAKRRAAKNMLKFIVITLFLKESSNKNNVNKYNIVSRNEIV